MAEGVPPKKSRRVLRQPAERTYPFIADHAAEQPVRWMCDALDVSASGYYAWAARAARPTQLWRDELVGVIEAVHAAVKQRYGSPRMHAELNARGHACSKNTVAKLMKAYGFRAKAAPRFVRTTDSNHGLPVAENVRGREFTAARPNEKWAMDITSVPTREGWLYLAVVEDLFSRMVVGGSMAATMASRLVVDARAMGLARRRPAAGRLAPSDRGRQYASEHYQPVLAAEGIACRMSEVGPCGDNAPVESFFGRMKCEIAAEAFETKDQAKAAIFEYLEVFYNRARLHSSLGFVSPVESERAYHQNHR